MISETDKPRTYAQMIAALAGEDESLRQHLLCELGALVVVDPPLSYDEITERMIAICDELKQTGEPTNKPAPNANKSTGSTGTFTRVVMGRSAAAPEPSNIRVRHLIYSRDLLPNSDRNYEFGEGEGKQIEKANIVGFEKQNLILYVYVRDGELQEAQAIAEQLIAEGLL